MFLIYKSLKSDKGMFSKEIVGYTPDETTAKSIIRKKEIIEPNSIYEYSQVDELKDVDSVPDKLLIKAKVRKRFNTDVYRIDWSTNLLDHKDTYIKNEKDYILYHFIMDISIEDNPNSIRDKASSKIKLMKSV